ncbi:MAG: tail fiber protein [Dehalobacterium sp.]
MSQFLGEIRLIVYDDIPVGWMKCEGQFLDINKYPKLYMMIGTKFGQNGKFTFALLDLREKAPENLFTALPSRENCSAPKRSLRSENLLWSVFRTGNPWTRGV